MVCSFDFFLFFCFPNSAAMNNQNPEECLVCFKFHPLRFCNIFKRMTTVQRAYAVRVHKYCVNCLARTHLLKDCRSAWSCQICGNLHHTLLHPTSEPSHQQSVMQWLRSISGTSGAGSSNRSLSSSRVDRRYRETLRNGVQPQRIRRQQPQRPRQQQQHRPGLQQPQRPLQHQPQRSQRQTPLRQQQLMSKILSSLGRIAGALNVAAVQGGAHVGNQPNTIDDIDMNLIDLN